MSSISTSSKPPVNYKDLTGQTFGQWTVLSRAPNRGGKTYWFCRCSCGVESEIDGSELRRGGSTRCKACAAKTSINNLTDQTFGHWTVIQRASNRGKYIYWICRCSCGIEKEVSGGYLKSGQSTRCAACCNKAAGRTNINDLVGRVFGNWKVINGRTKNDRKVLCECLKCNRIFNVRYDGLINGHSTQCDECAHIIHNHAKKGKRTREYSTWRSMIQRCTNPNNKDWDDYGGRGIKVCQRWLDSFENFLADMKPKPAGLSIDRKNNDGDYEPGNCEWATASQQTKNQRRWKSPPIYNKLFLNLIYNTCQT